MLKKQVPVRRWKLALPLPLLAAAVCLVGRPAQAQTGYAQVDRVPTDAEQQARQALIRRKTRAAMHQDSLRGPFEPGTTQEVRISNLAGDGEPTVQVGRVRKPTGSSAAMQAGPGPQVYTYVEQMPALPGGGGNQAIVAAVLHNLVYPAGGRLTGKVYVKFIVRADGSVTGIEVVKGLADAYDRAAVEAVRKLPRFVPGRQGGKPVAVTFTLPIEFVKKR